MIPHRIPSVLLAALGLTLAIMSSAIAGGWQRIFDPYTVQAIAVDPTDANVIYVGTSGNAIFKTTDGGTVWNPTSSGMTGMFAGYVLSIAIDPTNPNTLYAGTNGDGIYKSTDGAASWNPASTGLGDPNGIVMAIDPTTPSTVYAGTFAGVYKTVDGGANWAPSTTGITGNDDVFGLVVDPTNPSTLYAATNGDTGLYKSIDAGGNWNPANTGLPSGNVLALAMAPSSSSTLYAGTQPGGVSVSVDAAASWTATGMISPSPYITALALDPTSPAMLFAGTFLGPVRSLNGGTSWSAIPYGLVNTYTLALASGPTGTIYGGFSDGLYRFQNFCGDSILDAGEQCDDGNVSNGDCCSSTCQYDAPGTACTNEGNPCTADTCDGAGNCEHAVPAPGGCSPAKSRKASFVLKKDADSAKDGIAWKWAGIDAVAKDDFGSPDMGTGLTLCISDAVTTMGLSPFQGGTCGTNPCWTDKPTSFQYKDKAGASVGINGILLKSGATGKARIKLKAKGANLGGLIGVTLNTPVLVRLVRTDSPLCWEAVYSTALRNDAKTFKAKSD